MMKRMITLSIFQVNSYTGTKKEFNIYMIDTYHTE